MADLPNDTETTSDAQQTEAMATAVEPAEQPEQAAAAEEVEDDEELFTHDIWTLHFHDPYDANWNLDSYKRLCSISSAEEFWGVHARLKDRLHAGMFFLFRDHIFPCWDDPHNKDGGCLSMKVLKQDVGRFWEYLAARVLGECATKDAAAWETVTGISVSPKRSFAIVKLWLGTCELADRACFDLPPWYNGEVLFKSNLSSMEHK